MKTTSYKISKELEILGFKDLENASVRVEQHKGFYNCYYLETILDALPKSIENLKLILDMETRDIYYMSIIKTEYSYCEFQELKQKGESLADTAARLLITLIKDKIVEL
tara:strand:- start:55704 stop:56030 length:327 start_codon:yes stop_codon:yes gene_type:complete